MNFNGTDISDMDDEERIAAIKRLIRNLEGQIATDFTHNEPMKARLKQYKKWLREMESESDLHGYC